MTKNADYAVVLLHGGAYRLDRTTPPSPGVVATIALVLDRAGQKLGWRLRPHVFVQGPRSRIWPTPAEALAATKLLTLGQARAAIEQADASSGARS